MKILIISNMYPSTEKSYSGIFVKNQYEYFSKKMLSDIEIYFMKRTISSSFGSFYKYTKFLFGFIPFLFFKYDIIHVHFFGYHSFLGYLYKLLRPKSKLIITFHGSDKINLEKRLFKIIMKRINTIIAVGQEQSKNIYEITAHKDIRVLSGGINEKVFYKNKNYKNKYDFIFIGSFFEKKGTDIFISAIKILNNKNYNYCFVGSGHLLFEIKCLQKIYNITIIENETQDGIRKLLNQSKWLILPTRTDSFGLVVSEAMFSGTPVIVSNIGGMKEQVIDGTNGFILKENTPKEVSLVIQKAYSLQQDDYKKMVDNALKSNKQHSLENVCGKLKIIYEKLIINN